MGDFDEEGHSATATIKIVLGASSRLGQPVRVHVLNFALPDVDDASVGWRVICRLEVVQQAFWL